MHCSPRWQRYATDKPPCRKPPQPVTHKSKKIPRSKHSSVNKPKQHKKKTLFPHSAHLWHVRMITSVTHTFAFAPKINTSCSGSIFSAPYVSIDTCAIARRMNMCNNFCTTSDPCGSCAIAFAQHTFASVPHTMKSAPSMITFTPGMPRQWAATHGGRSAQDGRSDMTMARRRAAACAMMRARV